MTAAEKMTKVLALSPDTLLIDTYRHALAARHGDAPDMAHYDEYGIVIRYAEAEMDKRGIDVDAIIEEVLHR
jgi:hypothetical protein